VVVNGESIHLGPHSYRQKIQLRLWTGSPIAFPLLNVSVAHN